MVVVLSYLDPAILWQADNINNCKLKVNLQVGPALGRLGSTIIGVGRKNRPNANYRWSSWVWELNRLKFKIFRDNYLQMNLVNIPQISKESPTDRSQHAFQISPGIHTAWVAWSRDEKLKTPPRDKPRAYNKNNWMYIWTWALEWMTSGFINTWRK